MRSIVKERYYQAAHMQREHARLWPRAWLAVCRSAALDRGPRQLELTGHTLRVSRSAGGVPFVEWAGFVWASLMPECELDAHLGPLKATLEPYGLESWRTESWLTTELACNWKLSLDAHNEGYHVSSLHPEVLPMVDDQAERITLLGDHSRIVVPMGRPSRRLGGDAAAHEQQRVQAQRDARRPEHANLSDDQLSDNHQLYVFPNMQLNVFADHALVFRHRPHATDAQRCFFDQLSLVRGGGRDIVEPEAVPPDDPRFGRVTGADLALLPALQRGLRSRGFRGGVLSRRERCIAHMHDTLDRWLA